VKILGNIVRRIVGYILEMIGSTIGLKVNVLDVGAEVVTRDILTMDGFNEYHVLDGGTDRLTFTLGNKLDAADGNRLGYNELDKDG